ncbi:MAG: hypothetical protein MH252_18415 [Thermosynechococcaceae cyanobacterium MS004]|nr:hypothetical protein [Thermosynechococcaceae cyanobacterium MS004]
MAKKNFSRVSAVSEKTSLPNKLVVLPQRISEEVLNLERIDLADRENWLRALEICRGKPDQSLDVLLQEIETYQGQIDQALQTVQAQSTIYAYAIGTRLDVIEEQGLFKQKGYENLTAFIKNGEVRRPGGASITTRQVWAYRSVTRGLKEFLQIVESIRGGTPISPELNEQLEFLKSQVNQDVVESFLNSYAASVAGVLELGVSKLEQVCRLPAPVALSGLITGKLPLQHEIIEVHDVSFSQLRKAISSHERGRKSLKSSSIVFNVDRALDGLEKNIYALRDVELSETQKARLSDLKTFLGELG